MLSRPAKTPDKVVRSAQGGAPGRVLTEDLIKATSSPWETQETDYRRWARTGSMSPRLPARRGVFLVHAADAGPRHPYARGVLVGLYREAKSTLGDRWRPGPTSRPAAAAPPLPTRPRQGGLVRSSWAEATEMTPPPVHTIHIRPGPVAASSPIRRVHGEPRRGVAGSWANRRG